jgi:hypothetical protein
MIKNGELEKVNPLLGENQLSIGTSMLPLDLIVEL